MSQEGGAAPLAMSAGGGGDSSTLLKFIRQGRSFSGHEPHCIYLNTHATRFADVSSAAGLNLDDDGRAVGQTDWDGDGDLDFWIINRNGPQLRFMVNQLPTPNKSVAFKLRGTTCNRDAIGARVRVMAKSDPRPIVRSLRAGDGYLAQSSKWVHFGLAGVSEIEAVTVNWPGGDTEEFVGIEIGARYQLVQGEGKAIRWEPPRATVSLAELTAIEPPAEPEIHVLSVSRAPLPRLDYQTFHGEAARVVPTNSQRPVLLNLWAGWCQPCIHELSEWTKRADELRAVGLDVVALTVTGLENGAPATGDGSGETRSGSATRTLPVAKAAEDAELLKRLGFPFRSGVANSRLVETVQAVNDHLFDLHLPLPVPTSVLIGADGRLMAIYKGGVSVDRLVRDVEAAASADTRRHATPFAGRWNEPLNRISMVPLLDDLVERGLLAEADDFVRRLQEARKERLQPALVRLGMAFYKRGSWERAKEHFQVAVKVDPSFTGVELALAQIRLDEGRVESAVKLYREALRRNRSTAALNRLAWLLSTTDQEAVRDGAEAVRLAKEANERTNGADPAILDTLAVAQAANGNFNDAEETARRAAMIARSRGQLQLAKEIESRVQKFAAGQAIQINATR